MSDSVVAGILFGVLIINLIMLGKIEIKLDRALAVSQQEACLRMPKQDIEYLRSTSKTYGDKN